LNQESREEDQQREADWIPKNFLTISTNTAKKVKVCTRLKRWWTQEITENRKILD